MTEPDASQRFRGVIEAASGGGAAVRVPPDVATALGGLKQMRVVGTIDGRDFRSSTMPYRGGAKAGFATTFTVDRKDYGITWNRNVDEGGVLLGDDVEVKIQLETGWEPPKPDAPPAPAPSPTAKPPGR